MRPCDKGFKLIDYLIVIDHQPPTEWGRGRGCPTSYAFHPSVFHYRTNSRFTNIFGDLFKRSKTNPTTVYMRFRICVFLHIKQLPLSVSLSHFECVYDDDGLFVCKVVMFGESSASLGRSSVYNRYMSLNVSVFCARQREEYMYVYGKYILEYMYSHKTNSRRQAKELFM